MKGTTTTKLFSERLSDLIDEAQKNGKQFKDLAEQTGVPTGSLSKYQNDNGEAGINSLVKIADYFNVSTDWLLGRTEVRTLDTNVQSVCDFTGLSEDAVNNLRTIGWKKLKDCYSCIEGRFSPKGVLDSMLTNANLREMLWHLAYFCVYSAQSSIQVEGSRTGADLAEAEATLMEVNCVALDMKDASEYYLQRAVEEFKSIARSAFDQSGSNADMFYNIFRNADGKIISIADNLEREVDNGEHSEG